MRASIIIPQAGDRTCPMTRRCITSFWCHHGLGTDDLILIENASNIHAAWNKGAEQSRAEWLVFLNNDTITHGPWLGPLLHDLIEHNAVLTGIRPRYETKVPSDILQRTGNRFIEGWCFAVARHTWAEHRFCEEFVLYFGDTDFQVRVNGPMTFRPELSQKLEHLGHRSTRRRPDRQEIWELDRETFIRRWATDWSQK